MPAPTPCSAAEENQLAHAVDRHERERAGGAAQRRGHHEQRRAEQEERLASVNVREAREDRHRQRRRQEIRRRDPGIAIEAGQRRDDPRLRGADDRLIDGRQQRRERESDERSDKLRLREPHHSGRVELSILRGRRRGHDLFHYMRNPQSDRPGQGPPLTSTREDSRGSCQFARSAAMARRRGTAGPAAVRRASADPTALNLRGGRGELAPARPLEISEEVFGSQCERPSSNRHGRTAQFLLPAFGEVLQANER